MIISFINNNMLLLKSVNLQSSVRLWAKLIPPCAWHSCAWQSSCVPPLFPAACCLHLSLDLCQRKAMPNSHTTSPTAFVWAKLLPRVLPAHLWESSGAGVIGGQTLVCLSLETVLQEDLEHLAVPGRKSEKYKDDPRGWKKKMKRKKTNGWVNRGGSHL